MKNPKVSISNSKGFTLLEIMISLAIIGGLLITLIYTLNHHLDIAGRHETITIATLLAKEKIDEIGRSPGSQKGVFPEPYSAYTFETGINETSARGISEISVIVRHYKEEIRFSRLIKSPK